MSCTIGAFIIRMGLGLGGSTGSAYSDPLYAACSTPRRVRSVQVFPLLLSTEPTPLGLGVETFRV